MASERFAFCIIAHNEPEIFKTLVAQIDNPDNDIFVMIDKKADIAQFNDVRPRYSRIFFCQNRVDIRWGELSLVKAELEVYSLAVKYGKYLYYHLLSGQDLLIKPVERLNDFMRANRGKEFIGFQQYNSTPDRIKTRMNYFHISPSNSRSDNAIKRLWNISLLEFQKLIGVRRRSDVKYLGSNWASLSERMIQILISHKKDIYNKFRFTLCSDELYKQYFCGKFLSAQIFANCNEDGTDSLRLIDWNKGNPYIWQKGDYDELVNSTAYIARKFSSKDKELMIRIYNYTTEK